MRALVAGGLLAGPVLLGAGPAQASESLTAEVAADRSAWSWSRVTPSGTPALEPSGVPSGGLAVAFEGRPGTAAKATWLRLALSGLPDAAVLDRLLLVVRLDPTNSDDPATSPVVACPASAEFPEGEGLAPASMPEADCTNAPVAVHDAEAGTLVFDLTSAGRSWVSGASANHGVVLRPPVDAAVPAVLPYQLVLQGAGTVFAGVDATLPGAAVAPAPAPAGGGDEVAPPPSFSFVPPLVSAPQPPPTAPAPLPTAVVAQPPAPSTAPVVTVLARRPLADARSSAAGLWAASALGVALLALVSWAAGDTGRPVLAARAERAALDRVRRGQVPSSGAPTAGAVGTTQLRQRRQGRKPLSSATSTVTSS